MDGSYEVEWSLSAWTTRLLLVRSGLLSWLLLECREELDHNTRKVNLMWVPGHSGVESNEQVHKLDRRGAAIEFLRPGPVVNLPLQILKKVHDCCRY